MQLVRPFVTALIATGLWLVAALVVAPAGYPPFLVAPASAQGVETEAETQRIAKQLKCPVCENLSVADSPSPLAQQMRGIIREQVEAGQSRDEIVAYFVERYGEEVLLDPPKQGFGGVVWWGAGAGFAAGLLAVGLFLWQRRHQPDPDLEPGEIAVSDADLRTYGSWIEHEVAADVEPAGESGEQRGAAPNQSDTRPPQPEFGQPS